MKQQVKVMCIYLDGRSDNILLALFNATLFYVGRTICFSLDLFLMIFSLLFLRLCTSSSRISFLLDTKTFEVVYPMISNTFTHKTQI